MHGARQRSFGATPTRPRVLDRPCDLVSPNKAYHRERLAAGFLRRAGKAVVHYDPGARRSYVGWIPHSSPQEWNNGYRSWAHEARLGGCASPAPGFALLSDDIVSTHAYGRYVHSPSPTSTERDDTSWAGTDSSLPETASREPGSGPATLVGRSAGGSTKFRPLYPALVQPKGPRAVGGSDAGSSQSGLDR